MFSSQNSQVSGAAADPYFNQTTLLLHGDGTNGAQNNTFLDSSTNNFTITRNGNTTQGTFSPFSQAAGYWGNYFNGTDSSLSIGGSGTWGALSTGNFTIECWVYIASNTAIQLIADTRGGVNLTPWQFYTSSSGKLVFFYGSALTGTTTISANTWTHVAVVRSGSTITLYVNGTADGTVTSSANLSGGSTTYIGRTFDSTGTLWFSGYISNFRTTIGTAVYTANFTPSTVPLTAITNTSLLTCQSSRFVDNSTNNFTLTANGNVAVQPFSPFLPTAVYSTAVNGGSGYFNGTSDYISCGTSTSLALGVGDFTIECLIYRTANNPIVSILFDYRTSGGAPVNIPVAAFSASGVPLFYADVGSSVLITGSSAVPLNAWSHLAIVRNGTSANNVTMYLNGQNIGTGSNTSNLGIETFRINDPQSIYKQAGYFSSFRIVKGTAVYTANFTPPIAPLTAITNTQLLLGFTNAGIFDNAIKNNLETVGNAQISTSVVKYGTGSMALDGTGDYLTAPQSTLYDFGTGDFTVEFWTYMNATADTTFISKFISGAYAWLVQYISGTGLRFYWGNNGTLDSFVVGSWSPSTSTWYHVAVTRASGTLRLFIDGTQVGTTTNSSSYTSVTSLSIGRNADAGGIQYLNGYMDDIRITKGVARYTAAFTPPTAAFSNQ